ncbi:electron transport complex, RnfABCDGE type, B subunit [Algoriphagus alkaliphilus]|uniref:Ion-translocating oxidoreductase complex subunit B n=1 Tax=Algoriphagus alkaliphilus TaxID=279824 RepID=A0A1G5UZ20_9BACT|nr:MULTISPECIES: RnfABCDGE type electron transport complex subunit B [Algoriphagus]MDP2040175.1 RnfABCDGE type electron transport complex subunit B [Algoriphagus sp.]MDP3471344.1 RnfABCDGE type electron transport complex subunit B [Algoriphagus sp.]SDA38863.1 electron transport complex, RnfABCDGE type, B subunit [Algoriphagus alkaliphilus]
MTILIALLSLGGLTLFLAVMLIIANKKLYVYEDPRIDEVEAMLPHANCGACGYPGCRPFAEALVKGEMLPGKCSVSSEDGRNAIAAYLGVDAGMEEKRVARLACAGGSNVAVVRAEYEGLSSCRGAALISGGGKGCSWGCLGHGDCEKVCDFDAISMNEFGIPIVDEAKCTACGDCVEVCPKDLFSLHPISHRLWVACKSLEAGDGVLEDCEVGCTACGKCAMDAKGDLITMKYNLPVINYSANHQTQVPIQRCPTGAIVWLDEKQGPIKGAEAKKIIRKGKLKMGES